MKSLIKILLIVMVCFASTFILIKFTGVLTIEQIQGWLEQAKDIAPIYVGIIIAILLFSDLFIAIPTLTVTILSGYFLGHFYGAFAAFTGIMLAGICGYTLSYYFGDSILNFLIKNKTKRIEAIHAFQRHGFIMILLSRAMPILPETTACLSGMTNYPFNKFITAWLINSVPYILIATYAGSISSINNPKPAIITVIGITGFLWVSWFIYNRKNKISG